MADITDDFGRVNNVNSADLESLAKALKSAVGQAVKYMSEQSKGSSDLGKKINDLADSLEKLGDDVKESTKSTKDFVEKVVKAADDISKQKEQSKSGLEGIRKTQQEHTKVLAAILRSQQKAQSDRVAKYTTGGASLGRATRKSPALAEMGFKPRGTDKVPAMLSPGEFIVNKKGTRGNERILESMNRGYRLGGKVKPAYLAGGSEIPGSRGPRPMGGGDARVTVEFEDMESLFSDAGEEAAVSFSERFDKETRQKMARWATGVSSLLMGGHSFTQILFSGSVRDATEFRVEMRELAFQTQGITGDLRGLQAEFSNLGNSIVSQTGKSVDVLHRVYIKNLKKGFQENKAGLKTMKSGLFLSTMIGSEAEATADLFGDWYRTLRLSAEQMDSMAFNMKDVARMTGVTGDELLGAMKSSEGLLKNLKNQGNLTTGSAKALVQIMAEAKKSGTEETTGRIMDALTSTNKLLGAGGETKALVFSMASKMEATNPGATKRALGGTLMNTRQDRNAFADSMMDMLGRFSDGAVKSIDDFDKLDETQRYHLTMRLKAYGLEIDEAKELYKQIKKSSAPMSERLAEIDKIANSKFATEEEKKLANQQKSELYMSESMGNLSKFREKSSKMGVDQALAELSKDKDFQAQMKDFSGMSGALTDSMKRQFGLSGSETQIQSQMAGMKDEKKLELSSLIAANQAANVAKEKGIEYKDFGPDMAKALERGDGKAFSEAYDNFIAERKKLDVQLEAETDPTKALTLEMTKLNETIRNYTSSLVGGFIDLIGALGLFAMQLGLQVAAFSMTFGKGLGKAVFSRLGNIGSLDEYAKSIASSETIKDGMFKKFFQTYTKSRDGISGTGRGAFGRGGAVSPKGVMGSLNDAFGGMRDDMLKGLSKMKGATVDFFQNAGKSSTKFFNSFLAGFKKSWKSGGGFFKHMTKGFGAAMKSSDFTRGVLHKMGGAMKGLNGRYVETLASLRKTSPALASFVRNSVNFGKSFATLKFGEAFMHFGRTMKSGFQVFKNVFKPSSWKALFSMGSKGLKGAILGGSLGTAQIIFSAIDMVFGAVSGFMNTGKNFEGVLKAMGKSTKEATWGMYASSTVAGALVGILDGLTFGLLSMTGATKWLNETLSLLLYTIFSVVEGIVDGFMEALKMVWSAFSYIGEQFKSMGDSLLGVFNSIAGIFGVQAGNWSEAMAMIYPWLKAIGKVIGFVIGMPLVAFLWLVVKGISAALVPIQMLINAIAGVIKIFAGIIQFFKDIFTVGISKAFWNLGSTVLGAVYGVFKPVVDFIGSLVKDIMAPFKWLYNILVGNSIIPDLCVAVVGFFGKMALKVLKYMAALPLKAVKFMASLPLRIFKGLNNVFFKTPAKIFGKIFKHLSGKTVKEGLVAVSGRMSKFFGLFGKNLTELTGFFSSSWFNFLNTASGGIFGKIVNAVKNSKVASLVDDFLIKPIAKGLAWLGNKAGEVFSWAGKRAKEVFGPAFNWIKGQVSKLIPGAKSGAEAASKLAQKGAAKIAEKTGIKAAMESAKAARFAEFKRLRATGLSATDAKAQMGSRTKDLASKATNSLKDIARKGLSKATELAPKTTGIIKAGASKATSMVSNVGSKLSGKGGAKAASTVAGSVDDLAKAAPTALSFLGKSSGLIKGMAKKLPVVGPMLDFGIRTMSGESLGKATAGTAAGVGGGLGGAALGATIGTMIFPGVGTAIGGLIGGIAGGVGAGMASDAVYDKVVGTGGGTQIKKAAETASARMENKSTQVATPVGQHAIPTVRPESDSTAGVQPVHLRDITESILRERAGSGGSKLQSDELSRMEESANKQVAELEQIREGIKEMVSLLKPKAGGVVGEGASTSGRTRDPRRPLHAANFGKMKYGKMGGNANRSLVNNGES